jgi:hypothetical protein
MLSLVISRYAETPWEGLLQTMVNPHSRLGISRVILFNHDPKSSRARGGTMVRPQPGRDFEPFAFRHD